MRTKWHRMSSVLTAILWLLFSLFHAAAQESNFGYSNSPDLYNSPQEALPPPETTGNQYLIDEFRYFEMEVAEADRKMKEDEQFWEEAMQEGRELTIEGAHLEAEALYKGALQRAESFGRKDRRYIDSMWELATCYMFQAKYDEAEAQYEGLIKILEKKKKRDHSDLAEAVATLGQVYYNSGRYALALPQYERAQRLFERLYPTGDPRLGVSINNLATLHHAMENFPAADAYFSRALKIAASFRGSSAVIAVNILENYADFLTAIGREDEASALMIKARNSRRLIFAKQMAHEAHTLAHPDENALLTSANLGDVKAVKRLLKDGVYVDARDDQGLTALMASAASGEKNVIKALLKAGADVNTTDVDGKSALCKARENGHKDVIKLLAKAGAKE